MALGDYANWGSPSGAPKTLSDHARKAFEQVRAEEPTALVAFHHLRSGSAGDLVMVGASAPIGFMAGALAHQAMPRKVGPLSIPATIIGGVAVAAGIFARDETLATRGSLVVAGVTATLGGIVRVVAEASGATP